MENRFKFRAWFTPISGLVKPYMVDLLQENCYVKELEDKERWKVMQCIGLKDKNGKLIFEQDYLKRYKTDGREYKKIHRILWCGHFYNDILRYHEQLEVIGNLYENPELCELS